MRICNPFDWWFNRAGGYTEVIQRLTTFSPSPRSHGPYDQMPRRLGAGGALTVLRFVPVHGYARDWVLYALKSVCARFEEQGCDL
jgi:hypothetical protein